MKRFLRLSRIGLLGWFLLLSFYCMQSCQSDAADDAVPTDVSAAHSPEEAIPEASIQHQAPPPADMHHKIVQNPDGTWGYDVYIDGKLTLHQPHIPALPGNAGFETEAQAEAVAQLILQKINNGEMPPTLSAEEVKELMTH